MNTTGQPSPVSEGDVIDGKYRVDRVLGVGGIGVVVAATHLHLEQRVALKFLLPATLANPEVVARFSREARAAVKIKSEHVAKVYDVGTLSTGAPYIVMEFLEGEDLEHVLARRGALPVVDAVDYVLQACEAIAEAHSYGIVHRDLKPANLFLATVPNGRPTVKVLDFGISKSLASDGVLTKTSAIMGSPAYMSPEQMEATKEVDARGDIWSLGVVLFELLTGRRPFMDEAVTALMLAVLRNTPPAARTLRPDIPLPLNTAVMRCLEKEASQRWPSVAKLAAELVPYGRENAAELGARISHSLGLRAAETSPFPETTVSATPSGAPWSRTSMGLPRAHPRGLQLLGAALVLGLGGVLVHTLTSARGTTAVVSTEPLSPVATSPAASSTSVAAPTGAGPVPASVPSAIAVALPTPPPRPSRPAAHHGAIPSATAAPPPARPKVSCTPPFTVDANGVQHYKPECNN